MSKRPANADTDMQSEYDFSGAVRGKFFPPKVTLVPPIHLGPDVLKYFQSRAKAKGTTLSERVNTLIKKDIELIEAVG